MSVEVPSTTKNMTPRQRGKQGASGQVDAAVRGVGLAPAFQPIVSLPDGAVVGFEALARWPTLNGLNPQLVFARAKAAGRVDQLDQLCIDTAITSALEHRLGRESLLCINCEPTGTALSAAHSEVLARGRAELQMMFELTERSLLEHPHVLLAKVAALRADGFAVALDDVGAHPDSLALLDVISPDVVKLDLGLVQSQPGDDQARTLSAVLAHHERTGAVILAEGIETDEHLEQALAVGATLGQGHMFGRPGRLGQHPRPTAWSLPARRQRPGVASPSIFDLVRDHAQMRTGRKRTLMAFSHQVETQARCAADPPILLTALQSAQRFTGRTRAGYCEFAAHSPLVAVFGDDLPTDQGPGVRQIGLAAGDPLTKEWIVLALGPHTAAALIAREHDDAEQTRSDEDRRFDYIITYDRAVVTAAACNLLDRIP